MSSFLSSSSNSSVDQTSFDSLKIEFTKGKLADLNKIKTLLAQLKIQLSEAGLLFPVVASNTVLSQEGLITAREILEIGAFTSIQSNDVPSFERYLSLLSTFYNDFQSNSLPISLNQVKLYALSLLRLLSQNRIAEFHLFLETLSNRLVETKEIDWVLQLERSLMEGSYAKVYRLCSTPIQNLPLPHFEFFTQLLIETIRIEIASCDERAYDFLPIREVQTLLFLKNEQQVREFVRNNRSGWKIDEGKKVIRFNSNHYDGASVGVGKELDRHSLVKSVVGYAKELESIV